MRPATLFPPERLERIQDLLAHQQRVSVSELVRLLKVSPVTVRADLTELERRGVLTRIHGGAMANPRGEFELSFEARTRIESDAKHRIGAAAAEMVRDGETIALDSSTTAVHVARALGGRRELTVITNGVRVAEELAKIPGISIIMPGGTFRREIFSLVGGDCRELLKPLNVRRAFLSAKGFTLAEGLTDVNRDEVETRRALAEAAKEVIAILDHTKWGHVALAYFCASRQVNVIISDRQAPRNLVKAARAEGIHVRLV